MYNVTGELGANGSGERGELHTFSYRLSSEPRTSMCGDGLLLSTV